MPPRTRSRRSRSALSSPGGVAGCVAARIVPVRANPTIGGMEGKAQTNGRVENPSPAPGRVHQLERVAHRGRIEGTQAVEQVDGHVGTSACAGACMELAGVTPVKNAPVAQTQPK